MSIRWVRCKLCPEMTHFSFPFFLFWAKGQKNMEGFVFKLSEHIYLYCYSLGTNTKNKQKKNLRLIYNKVCYLNIFIWILLEANTETKAESQWRGGLKKHQQGSRQEKEGRQQRVSYQASYNCELLEGNSIKEIWESVPTIPQNFLKRRLSILHWLKLASREFNSYHFCLALISKPIGLSSLEWVGVGIKSPLRSNTFTACSLHLRGEH